MTRAEHSIPHVTYTVPSFGLVITIVVHEAKIQARACRDGLATKCHSEPSLVMYPMEMHVRCRCNARLHHAEMSSQFREGNRIMVRRIALVLVVFLTFVDVQMQRYLKGITLQSGSVCVGWPSTKMSVLTAPVHMADRTSIGIRLPSLGIWLSRPRLIHTKYMYTIQVPLSALLVVAIGAWEVFAFRRRSKGTARTCRVCRYDLRGLPSDKCPECWNVARVCLTNAEAGDSGG